MTTLAPHSADVRTLMGGPLAKCLLVFANGITIATRNGGEIARECGIGVPEYASAIAVLALEHTAWSLLSAAAQRGQTIDPDEFAVAARAAAERMVVHYAQEIEKRGAVQQ